MSLHSELTLADIHAIHSWQVADETARLALVVDADDIGKVCKQGLLGSSLLFYLVGVSPTLWLPLGSGGGGGITIEDVEAITDPLALAIADKVDTTDYNAFTAAVSSSFIVGPLLNNANLPSPVTNQHMYLGIEGGSPAMKFGGSLKAVSPRHLEYVMNDVAFTGVGAGNEDTIGEVEIASNSDSIEVGTTQPQLFLVDGFAVSHDQDNGNPVMFSIQGFFYHNFEIGAYDTAPADVVFTQINGSGSAISMTLEVNADGSGNILLAVFGSLDTGDTERDYTVAIDLIRCNPDVGGGF